MKKVLSLVLASLMLVALLAACGSTPEASPSPTPTATPSADPSPTPAVPADEDYEAIMGAFVGGFDVLVNDNLVALVADLAEAEDFAVWAAEFDAVLVDANEAVDSLETISELVPVEDEEQFTVLAVAAVEVQEVLASFEDAVAAGEVDADEFATAVDAAIEAWNTAMGAE